MYINDKIIAEDFGLLEYETDWDIIAKESERMLKLWEFRQHMIDRVYTLMGIDNE